MLQNECFPVESRTQEERAGRSKRQSDFKACLLRKCGRVRLGEVAAELLLPVNFRDAVVHERVTFSTPFGMRRLDNFHPETREAVESRNARAVANQLTLNQVMKDAYLLKTGQVSRVTWLLFFGASPRLLDLLDAHDIRHVEGWDALLAAGRASLPRAA